MKQYRITAGSVDSVRQFPAPEPEPRPRDLLVRMRAFSLNYRDVMMAEGRYGAPTPPGLVPLSDGAGEVVAVGSEVRRFKPGDRVASCFFADWPAASSRIGTTAPCRRPVRTRLGAVR